MEPEFFKHEIIAIVICYIDISLLSSTFAFQTIGKLTLFLRIAFTTSFKIVHIMGSGHIFLSYLYLLSLHPHPSPYYLSGIKTNH